jgi:four helix bundle protein
MTEICLREADETLYWLELLAESNLVRPLRLASIMDECNQLVAILVATVKRAKLGQPPRA